MQAKDVALTPALARLKRDADRALTTGPFSVTNKASASPGGTLNDYASQSPYYWANPDTPNGLPYVYRDGEVNPERAKWPDDSAMWSMISNTQSLALGYYFTGDERYASRAVLLLRTWFLDERTRMNPSMDFGQFVPGKNTGTQSGIIDSHDLPQVLDAIGLLAESPALTSNDERGLSKWFAAYSDWLTTAKIGRDEGKATNNHGTFYDTQIAGIALFLGDTAKARTVLETAKTLRITSQVQPDGQQPLELKRTRAWSYSVFNLDALFRLAALGDRAGVDLWGYRTSDGRSVRAALDWLAPYAAGAQPWTMPQITPFAPRELYPLLRQAANAYRSPEYRAFAVKAAPANVDQDRTNLTIPYQP